MWVLAGVEQTYWIHFLNKVVDILGQINAATSLSYIAVTASVEARVNVSTYTELIVLLNFTSTSLNQDEFTGELSGFVTNINISGQVPAGDGELYRVKLHSVVC